MTIHISPLELAMTLVISVVWLYLAHCFGRYSKEREMTEKKCPHECFVCALKEKVASMK